MLSSILKLLKNLEWDLPKGHQEKDETLLETAFRELEEETKINKSQIQILKNNKNLALNYSYEYQSSRSTNIRKIYLFLALTTKNPIISNEHCGYAWCNLEESLSYLKFKEIKKCVEKLYSEYIFYFNE